MSANVTERAYAPPELAVSVVILSLGPTAQSISYNEQGCQYCPLLEEGQPAEPWVLLVRRIKQPYANCWALPGAQVVASRSLESSAWNALTSTTQVHVRQLSQLATFGDPERSRGALAMVSVVYWAWVSQEEQSRNLQNKTQDMLRDNLQDSNVRWFASSQLPHLAFDHAEIIDYALSRLRHRALDPELLASLLPERFTLHQMHMLAQSLMGSAIDVANFRRRMLSSDLLVDTGERLRIGRHRPAAVYTCAKVGLRGDLGLNPASFVPSSLDALSPLLPS